MFGAVNGRRLFDCTSFLADPLLEVPLFPLEGTGTREDLCTGGWSVGADAEVASAMGRGLA